MAKKLASTMSRAVVERDPKKVGKLGPICQVVLGLMKSIMSHPIWIVSLYPKVGCLAFMYPIRYVRVCRLSSRRKSGLGK